MVSINMSSSRPSLDQWRALQAVVDHGSFEAAAEHLHRSQSAVSHAVRQLQARLPVAILAQSGRRTVLTEAGEALLRRSRALVDEAGALEAFAETLAEGWAAEIALAADAIAPPEMVLQALAAFGERSPQTRVDLHETVLSGTRAAIVERRVDLALSAEVPPGFPFEALVEVEFVAVASPAHALHRLERTLGFSDLKAHRQLVVRDTGPQGVDAGWLGAEQRWTVGHMRTSVEAIRRGLGFAWIPRDFIADDLAADRVRALPLESGGTRRVSLDLVLVDGDEAGPAARALADLLRQEARALVERRRRAQAAPP